MKLTFRNRDYQIERYPPPGDGSLQAVSAADEHLLAFLAESGDLPDGPVIHHDRFGALTVPLAASGIRPVVSAVFRSQLRSIQANMEANGIPEEALIRVDPIQAVPGGEIPDSDPVADPAGIVLMRVPKSLELFEMYLARSSATMAPDGRVAAGFMTRRFSSRLPEIAGRYFHTVEQSRAWKKSRLLLLAVPRRPEPRSPDTVVMPSIASVTTPDGRVLQQYPGVFSSGRIDPATRLLLDSLPAVLPDEVDGPVLDLGCGNGILSLVLKDAFPDNAVHAVDDSLPAVRSAELNLAGSGCHVHWNDSPRLEAVDRFGLIVSNPPFHSEHEIDISIPLRLFRESREVLHPGGILLLVANRHLNYSTHLRKSYAEVETILAAGKFEILRATA